MLVFFVFIKLFTNVLMSAGKWQQGGVKIGNNGYAIADNAIFYELTDDDEYKKSTSAMKAGYQVVMFETTDDNSSEKGADIVIWRK